MRDAFAFMLQNGYQVVGVERFTDGEPLTLQLKVSLIIQLCYIELSMYPVFNNHYAGIQQPTTLLHVQAQFW